MRWIVGSSMRLPVFVVVFATFLGIAAFIQVQQAPVDFYPEYAPPSVEVQTEAPGVSATEVESLITVPMEQEFNGVPWVDHIDSASVPGLSTVDLTFTRGTNLMQARQMVTERLAQGPGVAKVGNPPVMIQPLSATGRVMMVGLTSTDVSLVEMSLLARWKILPKLMGVPGVANVAIWGERPRQLQIQVDPARLKQNGITLSSVVDTAGNALWSSPLTFVEASTPGADGFVDTPTQRIGIQHVLPITDATQLADVTFADTTGRTVHLGDVTKVVEGSQPLIGDAKLKDGTGLILVVQKLPGASALQVTNGVEAAMAALRPGMSGITVDTSVYRPASYLQSALNDLGVVGLVGLVLLVIVVAALTASWRVTVIAVTAIAFSVVTSAELLHLLGLPFNVTVLAGLLIATVLIVEESAAVTVESRRAVGRGSGPVAATQQVEWIRDVVVRSGGVRLFATLATGLGLVPVVMLTGVGGAFGQPLVIAVAVGVAVSMVVAVTLVPSLTALLRPAAWRTTPRPRWMTAGARLIARTLPPRPAPSLPVFAALAVLLLAGAGMLVPQLHSGSLVPTPRERDLLVDWQGVSGTSLAEMERVTSRAADELRAVPGIREVGTQFGRAVGGDQTTQDVSSGQMWLSLSSSADYARTMSRIRSVLAGYVGMRHDLVTYEGSQLSAAQATSSAVTIRLYGQDDDVLRDQAQLVVRQLSAVPGLVNPVAAKVPQEPTLQIKVDLSKAQKYGLKPGDVRRATATLVYGLLVGNLYQDQRIFDVVVVGQPSLTGDIASVQNLLLDTPSGDQVRLQDVATVTLAPSPPVIEHHQASRSLDITAGVSDRSLRSVVDDVRSRVQKMTFPLEYHADVLSQPLQQQDDDQLLLWWILGAAVAVLLMLQAALRSWRGAFLLLVLLPFGCAGVILAGPLAGGLWSMAALAGFVPVAAITLRGGLALFRRIAVLAPDNAPGPDVVARAVRGQALPTLLASGAAAAVLAPFALAGDVAGMEVPRPLAVTTIGGLITSAVVVLYLLPALYLKTVGGIAPAAPAAAASAPAEGPPAEVPVQPPGRTATTESDAPTPENEEI
jgi:multidrug efflux pump subunit AcrB